MTRGRLLSEASAPELPLVVVVCGEEARQDRDRITDRS